MVTIKRTSQLSLLEKIDRNIDGVGDDYHKIAHILTGLFPRQFCFLLYTFLASKSSIVLSLIHI